MCDTFTCHTCRRVLPRPKGPGGMGYGVEDQGRKHCYQCCALAEFDSMVQMGVGVLYLVDDSTIPGKTWATDWAGRLRFVVRYVKRSPHGGGFGCQRSDFWFTGPDGAEWHGINRGDMQIARVRRTKSTDCAARNPAIWRERMRARLAAHIVPANGESRV